MLTSKTKQSGFTIVELLIVIIVIAILATLVITAYNGVQTKAKNSKTVSAVQAWVKAIDLYQADTGSWPSINSCLGDIDTYDGDGLCQNYQSPNWYVKPEFIAALKSYLGNGSIPEPAAPSVSTRGALYSYSSNNPEIYWLEQNASSCSSIGGLHNIAINSTPNGGVWCHGRLQNTN